MCTKFSGLLTVCYRKGMSYMWDDKNYVTK